MITNFRKAKSLVAKHGTPLLLVSKSKLKQNYHTLQKLLPRCKIYYAVKANHHKGVLNVLKEMGSNFDVASFKEIETLIDLGVDPTKMFYTNPIKAEVDIVRAYNVGVDAFVFDNDAELKKLARYAPESDVVVRIAVNNDAAYYKFGVKFGCEPPQANRLLNKAKKLGLNPMGICFHIGSQASKPDAFTTALDNTVHIIREAKKDGIKIDTVDIGGGFPVVYGNGHGGNCDPKSFIQDTAKIIDEYLPPALNVFCEPGRYIVGDACDLVAKVIGKSKRKGVIWYYLDDGYYQDFADVHASKWHFDFLASRKGKKLRSVLAGPTCDSYDVIAKSIWLPELELGDLVISPNSGAYASAIATSFNGFSPAEYVFVD
ncbi:TPA: type III PLP-dependent enzyme [Candidatus Micrarchaeota archaeon]|nr:type III PLP-dependent enzyme [Candidatus Micrarchaeota archaeon]